MSISLEVFAHLEKANLWAAQVTYAQVKTSLAARKEDLTTVLWAGIFTVNIAIFGLLAAIVNMIGMDSLGLAIYCLALLTVWIGLSIQLVKKAETVWLVSTNSCDSLWTIVTIMLAPWGASIGAVVHTLGGPPFDIAFALIPVTVGTGLLVLRRSKRVDSDEQQQHAAAADDGGIMNGFQGKGSILAVLVYFFWVLYILTKCDAGFSMAVYVHLILSGMLYFGAVLIPLDISVQNWLVRTFHMEQLDMKYIYFAPTTAAFYYCIAGVFFVIQIAATHTIDQITYWLDILCALLFGVAPPTAIYFRVGSTAPSAAAVGYIIMWSILVLFTSHLPSVISWLLNLSIAGLGLYFTVRLRAGLPVCCCRSTKTTRLEPTSKITDNEEGQGISLTASNVAVVQENGEGSTHALVDSSPKYGVVSNQ